MLRKQDTTFETLYEHKKSKNINAPSIEIETFSLSTNSNKINGCVNVFTAKISASERDQEVANRIDLTTEEFFKPIGDDFYQYALGFDLQKEKLKFKDFLAGSLMQENLKFWEENVGIHYTNDESQHNLPRNKVCIKLQYDQEKFPEYLRISFKGNFNSSHFEINFIDIEKQIEDVKKYNLTYLENISELTKEIESTSDQLNFMSNQERILLLSKFNTKWGRQLSMTYIIDNDHRIGTCKVEDKTGKTISNSSSNHIKIDSVTKNTSHANILFIEDTLSSSIKNSDLKEKDRNQPPSIVNSQMSFWKRNLLPNCHFQF